MEKAGNQCSKVWDKEFYCTEVDDTTWASVSPAGTVFSILISCWGDWGEIYTLPALEQTGMWMLGTCCCRYLKMGIGVVPAPSGLFE